MGPKPLERVLQVVERESEFDRSAADRRIERDVDFSPFKFGDSDAKERSDSLLFRPTSEEKLFSRCVKAMDLAHSTQAR